MCPASISGMCLAMVEGFEPCNSECEYVPKSDEEDPDRPTET